MAAIASSRVVDDQPDMQAGVAAHRAVSISAKAVDAIDPEIMASLIESARDIARRCDELLTQCQARESSASQAAIDLQERLQLGARMLKAFQTQINQLQALYAEARNRQQQAQSVEAQLKTRFAEFDAHIDAAHKTLDDRVEQAALAAIQRIEQAASSRIDSQPSERGPVNGQRPHSCEDLIQLSTLLHEAAQHVAHLVGTAVGGEKEPVRADALIEAKPKPIPVDAPVQPPLRLHA